MIDHEVATQHVREYGETMAGFANPEARKWTAEIRYVADMADWALELARSAEALDQALTKEFGAYLSMLPEYQDHIDMAWLQLRAAIAKRPGQK